MKNAEPRDHEVTVSAFLEDYVAGGKRTAQFVLSHPRRVQEFVQSFRQLPWLQYTPDSGAEADALRGSLGQPVILGTSLLGSLRSVLQLPELPPHYSAGPSRQTLRRKVRAARKLGVYWRPVEDPVERRELLELAHQQEQNHPQDDYRRSDPDLGELQAYRRWYAAYSRDHRPLLLSVTPVDGDWALLAYFRTLGWGEEESNARYLMTQVLAESLIESGVRYLLDSSNPHGLQNGLRHFQRMLGFRLVRVQTAPSARVPGRRSLQLSS